MERSDIHDKRSAALEWERRLKIHSIFFSHYFVSLLECHEIWL